MAVSEPPSSSNTEQNPDEGTVLNAVDEPGEQLWRILPPSRSVVAGVETGRFDGPTDALKSILRQRMIEGSPVIPDHVDLAERIFGKDVAAIAGPRLRQKRMS